MAKKLVHLLSLGLLILSFTLVLESPRVSAQEGELVWAAWENKDISTLGADNTGSTFAASDTVLSPAGTPTLQITPSGTS
ncbi:MAG: hypothetical protein HY866_18645, partial [Chloroflexi bacterium]|nr:hypothetical protein [Chloroflexota bacterium]